MNETILPNVTLRNGEPVTTSLDVAERFGREHKHVLWDIRHILEAAPRWFSLLNFELSYPRDRKQPKPMYHITKDGFAVLAMGFTGPAALEGKIAYINAFNRMAQELRYRKLVQIERQGRLFGAAQGCPDTIRRTVRRMRVLGYAANQVAGDDIFR